MTPVEGKVVTLMINVSNVGPADANLVTLNLPVPTNTAYQGHSGAGTYDPATGVWSMRDMTVGQNHTLSLTIQINTGIAPAIIPVTVTISGTQADPDSGNNADAVTLTV